MVRLSGSGGRAWLLGLHAPIIDCFFKNHSVHLFLKHEVFPNKGTLRATDDRFCQVLWGDL